MENNDIPPLFYLESRFFTDTPASQEVADMQERLRAAYPSTECKALDMKENPDLLPEGAYRIRFHSIGGYGTIATGKLLTDILVENTGWNSKSAAKYGSEKKGAPTNFYITLSPEPIKLTNAELEKVEIVISPDHMVFEHSNPLRGLVDGGTFILQSSEEPINVWRNLPKAVRDEIRRKNIKFYVVDAFKVAGEFAPTEDLKTRMMGMAFMGALFGNDERVKRGSSSEEILWLVRSRLVKKFGAKGAKVVDSNMQVIKAGLRATKEVPYNDEAYAKIDAEGQRRIKVSRLIAQAPAPTRLFDRGYFDSATMDPFREGTVGTAPVYPGAGYFIPPATADAKTKGLFRLNSPQFLADLCTGCTECAQSCPDAAIPNAVHEIQDILRVAIGKLEIPESNRATLMAMSEAVSNKIREIYRRLSRDKKVSFHEAARQAVSEMEIEDASVAADINRMIDVLEGYQVARTRNFFDTPEKSEAGNGGLYAVIVDPSKCTGCMACVEECGPGALVKKPESVERAEAMARAFEFFAGMPPTPERFMEGALGKDGLIHRVLLDIDNFLAMTGGHGACSGCGEVTALRFLTAVNRAFRQQQYKEHIKELEELIENLKAEIENEERKDSVDQGRLLRMKNTLEILEARLYYYESGPSGNGPANAVFANATGCSSVYASTLPFNPYNDPWVNSLFQDAPALAKGLFEGLVRAGIEEFKAIRIAKLELDGKYDPKVHDKEFTYFSWEDFSEEELRLLPPVLAVGGDGAVYDIGFGALSRLLATNTPVKVIVLNTGVYSNTGGQTSTASPTGTDSDLSRFGEAHQGKEERRKELGIIAAMHPKVFVVQTAVGMHDHFLRNILRALNYNESPAVLDIYTPCQPEHGIPDDASQKQARLAVTSRFSPVFVHDPTRGATLQERFSLEGNPAPNTDWATATIEYKDEAGETKTLEIPYTPADFAATEGRFKKHFTRANNERGLVPVYEYVKLSEREREGKVPFIYSTDRDKSLIKLIVTSNMVKLVEDRLSNWHILQELSGLNVEQMEERLRSEVEAWKQRYHAEVQAREEGLDQVAAGMVGLASQSRGFVSPVAVNLAPVIASASANDPQMPTALARRGESGQPVVSISEADMRKCTACTACYGKVPEVFGSRTLSSDGTSKTVAVVVPDAQARLLGDSGLMERVLRAANDCDAEIIKVDSSTGTASGRKKNG